MLHTFPDCVDRHFYAGGTKEKPSTITVMVVDFPEQMRKWEVFDLTEHDVADFRRRFMQTLDNAGDATREDRELKEGVAK